VGKGRGWREQKACSALLRAAEFFGDLLPALKMLKKAGEDAKVLSALAAAKGAVIDGDNIRLRKTFSIRKVEKQVLTDNDPRIIKGKVPLFPFIRHHTQFWADIIHKYATLNPDRAFVHAYPGRLLTSIFSSDSSSFTRRHEFGYMLGTSLYQESEEYMLHGFFSTVWGAFRIGEKGDDVGMTKFLESDEARRRLRGSMFAVRKYVLQYQLMDNFDYFL
jgi:hypothetical protein